MRRKNKDPSLVSCGLWYACADWIPVVSGMIHLQVLLAILLEVCTQNQQDRRDVEKLKFMQQDVVVNPVKALEKAMRHDRTKVFGVSVTES